MPEDDKVIEEARRKPLAERVEHKLWKVRVEAFEYIKSCCTKIFAEDDPALSEFGGFMRPIIGIQMAVLASWALFHSWHRGFVLLLATNAMGFPYRAYAR